MSLLSWLRRAFLENPLVGRHLSTVLTAPRFGLVCGFVAIVLLAADTIAIAFLGLASSTPELMRGGAGGFLHVLHGILLHAILVIFLPIRVTGAIDVPRLEKSFDQIVVTGLSPLRLCAGNWALASAFALVVLLVSLPFEVNALALGGVDLQGILAGHAVLFLHANLIIVCAIGFGMLEREQVATPLTIIFFALAAFLGSNPSTPAELAWVSPIRFFLNSLSAPERLGSAWKASPFFFSTEVSKDLYPFLLWPLLVTAWIIILALGPLHRFTPGMDNFGNVVLGGDRRAKLFRRLRARLTRRTEMAFFYENRPRWLERWDFVLRSLIVCGGAFLAWGIVTGLLFRGLPAVQTQLRFFRDAQFITYMLATAGIPLFLLLTTESFQGKRGWRERIGPWEFSRAGLIHGRFLLLLLGFVLLNWWALDHAVSAAGALTAANTNNTPPTVEGYVEDWRHLLTSVSLSLVNLHLLNRVLAIITKNPLVGRFLFLLAILCAALIPLGVLAAIQERFCPAALHPLLFLSPVSLAMAEDQRFLWDAKSLDLDLSRTFVFHVAWQLVVMAVSLLIIGLSWAISRPRTRPKAAPPEHAPRPATPAVILLLLGFLAAPGALLRAQEAPHTERIDLGAHPIDVEVTCGFGGVLLREGRPFFTVVLRNRSSRLLEGTLQVAVGGEVVSRRRPFQAPQDTAMVVRWVERDWSVGSVGRWRGGLQLVLEGAGGLASVDVLEPSIATERQAVLAPSTAKKPKSAADPGDAAPCFLVALEGNVVPRGRDPAHVWVDSPSRFFPEDLEGYTGLAAVFIDPSDLPRWTEGQRRALFDWTRLGGTVVAVGRLHAPSLEGTGEWKSLLASRESRRVERGKREYLVEDLEEGAVLWQLDARQGLPAVPLYTARAIGPGRVGHLSFDPREPPVEETPRASADLAERVPANVRSAGMLRPLGEDFDLRDSSLLAGMLGFLTLYVLLMGPGLALLFRKRSRRPWLALFLAGGPVLFALLMLALHASLHLRPSYASFTQLAFFGPGARRGVVQGLLQVSSSGRQQHQLELRGDAPSAFLVGEAWTDERTRLTSSRFVVRSRQSTSLLPLRLDHRPEGLPELRFSIPPWGTREILLLADATREAPITGRVSYDSTTGMLSLSAASLSAFESQGLKVVFHNTEDECFRAVDIAPGSIVDGVVSAKVSPGEKIAAFTGSPFPLSPPCFVVVVPGFLPSSFLSAVFRDGGIILPIPRRTGAFLLLDAREPSLDVISTGLAFEREVPEEAILPKRQAPGVAPRRHSIFERDGAPVRSFRRALILQELPLEIR